MDFNIADSFYKVNEIYSFTYNPEDKHQCFGDADRFRKCRDHFYQLLVGLTPNGIQYEAVIELSEPRKIQRGYPGSRYHIHGILKITHKKGIFYLLDQFQYTLSRTGDTDIDTCPDPLKWEQYMKKQSHIFGHRDVVLCSATDSLFKEIIDIPVNEADAHDGPSPIMGLEAPELPGSDSEHIISVKFNKKKRTFKK